MIPSYALTRKEMLAQARRYGAIDPERMTDEDLHGLITCLDSLTHKYGIVWGPTT